MAAMLAALLVNGCTAKPIPRGYAGPTAFVSDSATAHGPTLAEFFVLSKIEGKRIDESVGMTDIAYDGGGPEFEPLVEERELPAKPMTVSIKAQTYHGPHYWFLLDKELRVEGVVSFAPQPGEHYVVKGTLAADYSAVWIEDSRGATATAKVEKRGH